MAIKDKNDTGSKTTLLTLAEIRRQTDSIDVMEFVDYRLFVEAIYQAVKKAHPEYSYIQFSCDIGFPKTNFIWQIVNDKRGFTPKAATTFVEALGLKHAVRRYFLTLRDHNHARKPEERARLFDELMRIKLVSNPDKDQEKNLEYFSEWYHPVVRELVARDDFKGDPQWICKQLSFRLMPKQAQESMDLLLRLGLIKLNRQTGQYKQTALQIHPDRKVNKLASVKYHQELCDMARESITLLENDRRDLNGLTIRIADQHFEQLKLIIHNACEAIMELEAKHPHGDQVVQLNLQMFAYTKKRSSP